MIKKILSLLISISMILSLSQVPVLAEEINSYVQGDGVEISEELDVDKSLDNIDEIIEVPEEGLCIVNGTYYGISKAWFEKVNPDKKTLKLSVKIPSSVQIISDNAFRSAWSQTKSGKGAFMVINGDTKNGDYRIYNLDFSEATGLIKIDNQAAMRCPDIQGVLDLSYTKVKTIGKSAFYGCTGITGVILPDSLLDLGDRSENKSGSVFLGCTGLKYVKTKGSKRSFELPSNLQYIGNDTFKECVGAFPTNTVAIIPESVSIMGQQVFDNTDNITTIIVNTNNAGKYDGTAFRTKTNNYGLGKRLTIFKNSAAKGTFKASGFESYKNSITYEFRLHYGSKSDSDTKVEPKLWGQALNVSKDENGNWYVDENYKIPDLKEETYPEGYKGGWLYNNRILEDSTILKPNDDDLYLNKGKILKEPNIKLIVDGEEIQTTDKYLKLRLSNNKKHKIGVMVSHDIEKNENADVNVEFKYKWTDVWKNGIEGPRMKEKGFGENGWGPSGKNTITIDGSTHERTDPGNYSGEDYGNGYYLLEIYGYKYPKNGGFKELFYKSASSIIGPDPQRTTNKAYIFDVTTYTPTDIKAKEMSKYIGGKDYDKNGGLPEKFDLNMSENINSISYKKAETGEIINKKYENTTENQNEAKEELKNIFNIIYNKYADGGEKINTDEKAGKYTSKLVLKPEYKELKINNGAPSILDGTLVIRYTENLEKAKSGDNLSEVQPKAPTESVKRPTAVADQNTIYHINGDTERILNDKSGVKLLNEDIINGKNSDIKDKMKKKANETLKIPEKEKNNFEFYYLDLVDNNNGNVWITNSNSTTIYLPYPEGTDENTDLKVVYYKGLNREYEIKDENSVDNIINSSTVEVVKDVEKTDKGIKLEVQPNGFGAFATIWQKKESGGGSSGGGSTTGGTTSGGVSARESDIIGKDRYETAGLIADRIKYYNSVILVHANDTLADGLSAASLSGKENAPILLVKKDSIPKATMDRIKNASKVYIIGGEDAISKKVEEKLKGKIIERIGGKDRIETSMLIAEKLGNYDKAFIVNGYTGEADAMSASAAAAKYKAPIILTNGKTSEHDKKSNVYYYVIGGNKVVSNSLITEFNAKRLGGIDRYETNRLVIKELYKNSSKYYYTKGNPLVDALTISLHAKDNGVVLVSPKSDNSILKGKDIVKVGGMDFEIEPIE